MITMSIDAEPPTTPHATAQWLRILEQAHSKAELVEVVNTYLATWEPRHLMNLPTYAIPDRLSDANHIAVHAFTLVQKQCTDLSPNTDLSRMAAFFAAAAWQLSKISARARMQMVRTSGA
jgi:hypothetical protein